MKKNQKLTGLLLVVVVGILVLVYVLVDQTSSKMNRYDATSVAFSFATALRENNAAGAKSLTDLEQWHRIEDWMFERKQFECVFSWRLSFDPDNNEVFLVCSPTFPSPAQEITCGYGYMTVCANGRYRVSISELQMVETEQGWQVINWGKICESIDGDIIRCESN